MESLEEKSLKAHLVKVQDEIDYNIAMVGELKLRLADCRQRYFLERWKQDAVDVLRKYEKLVNSCCYQGGEGYKIWVKLVHTPCHWVVNPDKYDECQPTEMDKAAYYAMHGEVMVVPTKTHWEHWGN